MSSFKPLNVIEDDEESEEEIDDSKELQIEEALKLYQNALKLHSLGPDFFDQAELSYQELFKSEIFTYPESLPEAKWVELYGDTVVEADTDDDEFDETLPEFDAIPANSEATPSSLPQIVYLAHKNYGQFRLDQIKHRLSRLESDLQLGETLQAKQDIKATAANGLSNLVEALEKDDTDLELWRRVSRVSEYLGSRRVARYCLEAVLDNGDIVHDSPGLEVRFAEEQLSSLLPEIGDTISHSQLHEGSSHGKSLALRLRKQIDPCPFLLKDERDRLNDRYERTTGIVEVIVPHPGWVAIGKAILVRMQQESLGNVNAEPGAIYRLHLPDGSTVSSPSHHPATTGTYAALPQLQSESAANHIRGREGSSTQLDPMLVSPTESLEIEKSVAIPPSAPLSAGIDGNPNSDIASFTEHQQEDTGGVLINGSASLPTRKRSSDEADLNEANDAIRSRSKRLKARMDSSSARGESAEEWAKWYQSQLRFYLQADDQAFQYVDDVLSKLQCSHIGHIQDLRQSILPTVGTDSVEVSNTDSVAMHALRRLLASWDLPKSRAFLSGGGLQDPTKGSQVLGLSTFLEHSMRDYQQSSRRDTLPDDLGLKSFLDHIHDNPTEGLDRLTLQWLTELLTPRRVDQPESLYMSHLWPDALKETVVQLLILADEFIYTCLKDNPEKKSHELVQSIFELHIDIYGRITNPSSVVDDATRTLQRDRLCRWASLASVAVAEHCGRVSDDALAARFLWSTVLCNSLLEPTLREDTVVCYRDLITALHEAKTEAGDPLVIRLVNNALMPEMSAVAAEREISRLTTMDFFTSIFTSDDEDALKVVDRLEPFLDLVVGQHTMADDGDVQRATALIPETLLEALRFLEQASVSLKLFLWQKLRDAYGIINYPPMILSCNLRSLALIVNHLSSEIYSEGAGDANAESFLQWLHKVDELITQILAVILTDLNAFECVDYAHLRSMMTTNASLLKIMQVYAFWEDSIRVGQINAPVQPSPTASKQQLKSAEKFRDMIVKTWTLQYLLLKEATLQDRDAFETPNEYLLGYLKVAHHALGLRTYCSLASKIFLKLAKSEMLRMKPSPGWDNDLPQVIFDLHGLKISSNHEDIHDHSCESVEIDKATAFELLDMILLQVNRVSMKELLRSDLRFAVDKLQQVIKVPKVTNTAGRTLNRTIVKAYLQSPINPLELYRSLRGVGGLCCTRSGTEGWELAEKGWYFLTGFICLSKFRSQKRTTATSTEDLQNAATFFKLDLEFDTEKWETWYRLGQVYDSLLEELTTWSADKLDNNQSILIEHQRQAILCYTMAVAAANRLEEPTFDVMTRVADLYKDFGNRIYSSSREPFSMRAFSLEEYDRPYSSQDEGMYQRRPFTPLTEYTAWKFASALLQQSSLQKPNDWGTFYALGKALWKMHDAQDVILNGAKRIPYQAVTNALIQAVRCVPEKKDNKHPDKDPILEPHYKLLSVTHKLVRRGRCSIQAACRILKVTPYTQRVPNIDDPDDWLDYMLEILKSLRSADKSNWHHRMAYRAAYTIYETDPKDPRTWIGAKHELMQQIFTKTMGIQVWKPEHERSGRHFVYTSRYVQFLLRLLFSLKDKEAIETLAKKIRKKSGDLVNHSEVWQTLGHAYLALLRFRVEEQVRFPTVDLEVNTLLKKDPPEFQANAARVEAWVNNPATQCPQADIIRDAFEFKKLNLTLLDNKLIEQLIADTYAVIYETNAERLRYEEKEQENRTRMRMDNILTNSDPQHSENGPMDLTLRSGEGTPAVGQEPAPPKRRMNVITHREVIRRAEALMIKPAPIATPKVATKTLPVMADANGKSPGIAVVIPPPEGGKEIISVPDSPASVHDSADDESELSEVEDEDDDTISGDEPQKQQSMFPNLANGQREGSAAGDENGIDEYAEQLSRAGEDTQEGRGLNGQPSTEVVGKQLGEPSGPSWGGEVNSQAKKAPETEVEAPPIELQMDARDQAEDHDL